MLHQYQKQATAKELCSWMLLPRSNYYYKPTNGQRGFKPSTETLTKEGKRVSNTLVIDKIRSILGREFVCYGYQKVTMQLKREEYIINHKKVYRLMEESNLLLGKKIKTTGKREWVKHRKIKAIKPMEYLCLDIKYIWVAGDKRHYYLLTIIDVYSRKVLHWILQKSIRKIDVINLLRAIHLEHGIKGVNIRNDNGSQFIANDVRQFLRSAEARQEFTHIATPQENAYIEAYHSIIDTEIVQRYEFESYYDAKTTIAAYVNFYNYSRLHGSIKHKTPQEQWDEYENQNINFTASEKAEAGTAGEHPTRNMLMNGDNTSEGVVNTAPSSLRLSLFQDASKNSLTNYKNNLNSLIKSVQTIGG